MPRASLKTARTLAAGISVLAALALTGTASRAATVTVPAQPGALVTAVAKARAGDRLVLAPGIHQGPVSITRPLTLDGQPGAVIDGQGQSKVVQIYAPDVTVRGLILRNSGDHVAEFDGGIYAEKGSDRFVAENNHLDGTLFGIVIHGPQRVTVRNNLIRNRSDKYETDLGDGIYLWDTNDDLIEGNDIQGGRDGIFSQAAHRNILRANRMIHTRFAIHYMYSNENKVEGNLSAHNSVGFALMYSNNIEVRNNVSIDDRDHGLMLHTAYHSVMTGNYVRGTHVKCVFVYTAAKNIISGNRIEDCPIGLHFTGGSEENEVFGNAFINNQTQVKYTGTIYYEWSKDGRGNYWSDNTAFDLTGQGTATTAYRPNSVMERLVWRYPLAKSLMSSPVMEALRFAQSQFPALMPGGVIDSHPLMAPPPLPAGLPPLPESGS